MVHINWIMPRILDNEKIEILKDKLEDWCKSLQSLLKGIELKQNIQE